MITGPPLRAGSRNEARSASLAKSPSAISGVTMPQALITKHLQMKATLRATSRLISDMSGKSGVRLKWCGHVDARILRGDHRLGERIRVLTAHQPAETGRARISRADRSQTSYQLRFALGGGGHRPGRCTRERHHHERWCATLRPQVSSHLFIRIRFEPNTLCGAPYRSCAPDLQRTHGDAKARPSYTNGATGSRLAEVQPCRGRPLPR